ncbi:hypothetical protein A3D84_00170 [Candidatus Woesebacteria bacterium RIFCSPHIGHO2_02_FULL_42_20]|uniref:Bacterial type II secretion system protein E domain-containing protein n=1 Tax=Candidatus Woesebacteria bacterium RIFCSPHIGHO2_12_FULL_41_24 TaxID=1802510 RepID=A0A1F8AUB3_9BACT|nr:MAG: hypothetical protein A2W15_01670 [Candidatus Woesebacteria bacterium RBG_16_41_13]OGM29667.1 MAG: hypothetical protein A2873_02090 [Candidatus Woesebacteria bacterium RIFCSPHIGHO2_01_FULL_42_80]OGM35196.1 MAG: hypothetical protein A3D84_00170 [Candidatus Woesebacteria bacterium RIFCSPHIGHO2_02_FULL_42_20]OGM55089.1 MAG: hypothetical protein A3E44_04175 [Candidatus Woesebacteria bacterium RIFCSPHIGHO2_12_FULL_41_24]OGM67662.1 MAG: hypothetical protein A2969_01880 [Candidatus Woesebacteri
MKLPIEALKKILVDSGYVPEKDFDEAAKSSQELGRSAEDILIFKGFLSESTLGQLVAEHLKVLHANLNHKVTADEVLRLIPEKTARSYRILAFDRQDNKLNLAMEDPSDFEAIEFAKRQTGLEIVPYYAGPDEMRKALGQYKKNIREEFDKVIEENVSKTKLEKDPAKAAEELPVIKILDTIFEFAAAERASDIHIESYSEEVVVRFRIDGILRDIIRLPRGIEIALVARIKILSNLKIDEHRIPQDGRHRFSIDDDTIALRISIIPGFYGENVVMRLLPETSRPLSLEELGLTGKGLEVVRDNITKPNGMLLVTGPTGSGKTTTLYSILNILNTVKVKICTIEDPIEYGVKRVSQIQVNPKAGLDFAAGLRSLLRHDPDIIMVGEIRDRETAEIAVHSALTGHLVLSTLHTNTAAGAIPRFLDMGVEGYLLASTVNAVIAQRLVRKICTSCITEYSPDENTLGPFVKEFNLNLKDQKFYRGTGCGECHKSGYAGRIGIYEVMRVSESIRKLITQKSALDDLETLAVKEGMLTMLADGLNKVSSGLTTIDEMIRVVRES